MYWRFFLLFRCLAIIKKKNLQLIPKKAYQLLKETGDKPKFQIWTPPPRKKEMGESQKHTLSQIFIGIVHSAKCCCLRHLIQIFIYRHCTYCCTLVSNVSMPSVWKKILSLTMWCSYFPHCCPIEKVVIISSMMLMVIFKKNHSAFKMKKQMSYVPMIICWSLIMQAQLR